MTFDRPSLPNREALTTTPAYATMIALLGAGQCLKGVALSKTEYGNIQRIYKFNTEHVDCGCSRELLQAGADRNMLRHAECDGLRLLAWIAKFVEAGEDPVKVLINMAVEAGYTVDPNDVAYASDNEDEDGST